MFPHASCQIFTSHLLSMHSASVLFPSLPLQTVYHNSAVPAIVFSESALKSVFPLADGADQHAYQHSSGDGTFTHALQAASKAEAQHAGDEDEGHIKDDFHRTETDRQHFAYGERYAFAGKHDHIGADLQKDADRNQDASASSGESKNVPIPAIGIFTPLFSVTYSIFIASCLILILLYPARPQTEVSLRYEV